LAAPASKYFRVFQLNQSKENNMRWAFLSGVLAAMAGLLCVESAPAAGPDNPNLGKVRHVVLFKFKAGATPEQIKSVEDAFRALPTKIPGIVSLEWGTNISPENKSQGFTHCFLLTFKDAQDRDAYLPHPAHKAFGKSLRPILDQVLVFDFVAKD
jgi:hypothetical protein